MNRKAVFMDIDGTLIWDSKVSDRVLNAIQKARALGHMFFICTGRSKSYLPREVRNVDYLDGYVMSCGMHCEINSETIYREAFTTDELQSIARYACESGRACHFEGGTKILTINSDRSDFVQVSTYAELIAGFEEERIYKISIEGKNCPDDNPLLFDRFAVFDMGHYCDIVRKGISKATGMQRVLEKTGIPRENCIGIGDGSNDLPMIRFAGLGIAMGNAPDHVKAEADAVTETCYNDGVAVMIEKYILNK